VAHEAFKFIKGRSRTISLIDYKAEREFVDKVPYRILFSSASPEDADILWQEPKQLSRRRGTPRSCPF
jgi:hypothetical protein